jgi:ComF family protein
MLQWITDLLMLFFPSNCLVCGKRLPSPASVICFECEIKMPRTGFGDQMDNPVNKIFWGRVPVRCATSLFRFEKGSAFQTLLHDLKYRGNRNIGIYLGRLLGQELKNTSFACCDLLIPVPLHRKRFNQRGYNQSEIIARGVADIIAIPLAVNLIKRNANTLSQTSMNRQERFENMASAFTVSRATVDLFDKKVLLIDDVVTTGATLEACSQVLLGNFRCHIFIATVSYA